MAERNPNKQNKKQSPSTSAGKAKGNPSTQTKPQSRPKPQTRPPNNTNRGQNANKPAGSHAPKPQNGPSQQKGNSNHGQNQGLLLQGLFGAANPGAPCKQKTTPVQPQVPKNTGNGPQMRSTSSTGNTAPNKPSTGTSFHQTGVHRNVAMNERREVKPNQQQGGPGRGFVPPQMAQAAAQAAKAPAAGLQNPALRAEKMPQQTRHNIEGYRGRRGGGRGGRGGGRGGARANAPGTQIPLNCNPLFVGGTVGTTENDKGPVVSTIPHTTPANTVRRGGGQGGVGRGKRGGQRRGRRGHATTAVNFSRQNDRARGAVGFQSAFSQITSSIAHGLTSSFVSYLTQTVGDFIEDKMKPQETGHPVATTTNPELPREQQRENYSPVVEVSDYQMGPEQVDIFVPNEEFDDFDAASQSGASLWEDVEEDCQINSQEMSVVYRAQQTVKQRDRRYTRVHGRINRGHKTGLRMRKPTNKMPASSSSLQATVNSSDDADSNASGCNSDASDADIDILCSSNYESGTSNQVHKNDYHVSKESTQVTKAPNSFEDAFQRMTVDTPGHENDVNTLEASVREVKEKSGSSQMPCHQDLSGCANSSDATGISILEPDYEVDENLVINFLVTQSGETCSFYDVRSETGIFPCTLSPETIFRSLKNCRKILISVNHSDLDESSVKVYFKRLRLCTDYRPPRGCTRAACNYLHLCRDFLVDSCFDGNCPFEHDVESSHNSKIYPDCGVQIFSAEQKLMIIRSSNVQVCKEHNGSGLCPNPDTCFNLHICNSFVNNKCLIPGASCIEGHDFYTDHNKRILQLHEMDNFKGKLLSKMIVGFQTGSLHSDESLRVNNTKTAVKKKARKKPRKTPKQAENNTQSALETSVNKATVGENFKDSKDFAVKETQNVPLKYDLIQLYKGSNSFEIHKCDRTDGCTERHVKDAPYLWRVKINARWVDFENSHLIETEYCVPESDKFWGVVGGRTLVIDFLSMKCEVGDVQRLTTPSHSICRDRKDATRWQWYWWQPPGQWIAFGQGGKPPSQHVMEAKFLHDPMHVCCFEIEHWKYQLDFGQMELFAVDTNGRIPIRRRPRLPSSESGQQNSTQFLEEECNEVVDLPRGWAPMDQRLTELVSLRPEEAEYRFIRERFYSNLREERFSIARIHRIENLELWQKYQRKKWEMEIRSGPQMEVNVFHGTPEETTARAIWTLGFDLRMQGQHGSTLGQGLYFARASNYSNCYTRPSSLGLRYMFYARIVVGRTTDHGEHLPMNPNNPRSYDTRVDNINSPNVYVVADSHQCYPEFLIEYFERSGVESNIKTSEMLPTYSSLTSSASFEVSSSIPSQYQYSPGLSRPYQQGHYLPEGQVSGVSYPGHNSNDTSPLPQNNVARGYALADPVTTQSYIPEPQSDRHPTMSTSYSLVPAPDIQSNYRLPRQTNSKDCAVM